MADDGFCRLTARLRSSRRGNEAVSGNHQTPKSASSPRRLLAFQTSLNGLLLRTFQFHLGPSGVHAIGGFGFVPVRFLGSRPQTLPARIPIASANGSAK